MNERKVALESKAYQRLREIYFERDKSAHEWKEKGRKVIAVMGSDVPEEILYAANYLPVAVYPDYDRPTDTDLYLEESCDHDSWSRGVMQKLTDGSYAKLAERLVISYSTLRMYNLFNVLREVRRQMPDAPVPYVEFIDTDYDQTLLAQKHNINAYAKFRTTVETWIGMEIPDEKLIEAINIYNDARDAMREFDSLRRSSKPRVTGTEAMIVLGAAQFMPKNEYAALVRELTKEASEWPLVNGERIFVTGTDHDTTELYDLISELGGHVVMEDHNFGARYYERNITYLDNPIRGLVDRYIYRMPTGKVNVRDRVACMKECISAATPDMVLMYLKVNDIGASWDYPHIKKLLTEYNIPIVRFYNQETPIANTETVKAVIAEELISLKGGK